MSEVHEVPDSAWHHVRPTEPISLNTARYLVATTKCAQCRGRLVIDHDADPYGNSRLHCLSCAHDVADVVLL